MSPLETVGLFVNQHQLHRTSSWEPTKSSTSNFSAQLIQASSQDELVEETSSSLSLYNQDMNNDQAELGPFNGPPDPMIVTPSFVIISLILGTIVLCTFVGNLFVIVAIFMDKNLQTSANQLVLSLAVADLMVACLVMPLGAYNDIHQGWYLGKEICEFWTSADVLCCTASILNLLAIAIDRYKAVTNVDYIYKRTRRRVNLMILCAWTVGAVVSLAPIFGWKDPDFAHRVVVEHKCLVSQDVGYQIFATISTFYAPLVLLLALYWRIFQVARKRIRNKPGGKWTAGATAAAPPNPRRLKLEGASNCNDDIDVHIQADSQPSAATNCAHLTTSSASHRTTNWPEPIIKTGRPAGSGAGQAGQTAKVGASNVVVNSRCGGGDNNNNNRNCDQFNGVQRTVNDGHHHHRLHQLHQRQAHSTGGRSSCGQADLGPLLAGGAPDPTPASDESNLTSSLQHHQLSSSSSQQHKQPAPTPQLSSRRSSASRQITAVTSGVGYATNNQRPPISMGARIIISTGASATSDLLTRFAISDAGPADVGGGGERKFASPGTTIEGNLSPREEEEEEEDVDYEGHGDEDGDDGRRQELRSVFAASHRTSGRQEASNEGGAGIPSARPPPPAGPRIPAGPSSSLAMPMNALAAPNGQREPSMLHNARRAKCSHCSSSSASSVASAASSPSTGSVSSLSSGQLGRPTSGASPTRAESRKSSQSEGGCHCCCCSEGDHADEDDEHLHREAQPAGEQQEDEDHDEGQDDDQDESCSISASQLIKCNRRSTGAKEADHRHHRRRHHHQRERDYLKRRSSEVAILNHNEPRQRDNDLACLLSERQDSERRPRPPRQLRGRQGSLSESPSSSTLAEADVVGKTIGELQQQHQPLGPLTSSSSSSSPSSPSSAIDSLNCPQQDQRPVHRHSRPLAVQALAANKPNHDEDKTTTPSAPGQPKTTADNNLTVNNINIGGNLFDCEQSIQSSERPADQLPGGGPLSARLLLAEVEAGAGAERGRRRLRAADCQARQSLGPSGGAQQPAGGELVGSCPLASPELPAASRSNSAKLRRALANGSGPGEPSGALTTSRSLYLRRKFRALGQLVSFVQTSRPFNSSSSAPTSQSGDEDDANDEDDEDDDEEEAKEEDVETCAGRKQVAANNGPPSAGLPAGRRRDTGPPAVAGPPSSASSTATREPNDSMGAAIDTGQPRTKPGQQQTTSTGTTTTTTATSTTMTSSIWPPKTMPTSNNLATRRTINRENLDIKREKKAAKTLAIITGVFVCCWLPFFLNAIVMPVCGPACTPSDLILSVLLWLGYLNSLLNPIIYTIFSPDFRRAFNRLLGCLRWRRSSLLSASSGSLGAGVNKKRAHRASQRRHNGPSGVGQLVAAGQGRRVWPGGRHTGDSQRLDEP